MRLGLCLCLTLCLLSLAEGGGWIRKTKRILRQRVGPPNSRQGMARALSWPRFFLPKINLFRTTRDRRLRFQTEREDRQKQGSHRPSFSFPGSLFQYKPKARFRASWQPMEHGNPMLGDPTFSYAPPTLEQVKVKSEGRKPQERNHQPQKEQQQQKPTQHQQKRPLLKNLNHLIKQQYSKKRPGWKFPPIPRPALWKYLANKQRFRRPRPQINFIKAQPDPAKNKPNKPKEEIQAHQAEIFPRLPNFVYFNPQDVMAGQGRPNQGPPPPPHHHHHMQQQHPGRPHHPPQHHGHHPIGRPLGIVTPMVFIPHGTLRPGTVDDVPISSSEFQPSLQIPQIPQLPQMPPPHHPMPQSQEQFDQLLSFFPSVPKSPTVLRPMVTSRPIPTEPVTETTRNSAAKPNEATQTINNNNEKVTNSFNVNEQESLEGLESEPVVVIRETEAPVRVTEGPSSTSTTTTTSTTTVRPVTKISVFSSVSSEEKPSVIIKSKPSPPPFKKRPTPSYIRSKGYNRNKIGSSVTNGYKRGSEESKEKEPGSQEAVVITMSKSKVKEYKPQFLANFTQLLAFDKVAEGDVTTPLPTPSASNGNTTTETTGTTPKSVLEDFDPLQLIHSWFHPGS